MSDDKVIHLSQSMTIEPKRASGSVLCKHTSVVIDQKRRLLECKACGRMIDPFDHLWGYATGQQKIVWGIDHAKSELKQLHSEIDDLKRQKRNLKAQLARTQKKAAG